jgi:NAD(P)-dependent dehydrogenase (short-subunit alcohol dehydrogenase family)
VLFSAELARRTAGTGITTYSLHPGVIASDIWRRIPWPLRPLALSVMDTVEEGAEAVLDCAVTPARAAETGLYYHGGGPREPSRPARDPELQRRLWEQSATWCSL